MCTHQRRHSSSVLQTVLGPMLDMEERRTLASQHYRTRPCPSRCPSCLILELSVIDANTCGVEDFCGVTFFLNQIFTCRLNSAILISWATLAFNLYRIFHLSPNVTTYIEMGCVRTLKNLVGKESSSRNQTLTHEWS